MSFTKNVKNYSNLLLLFWFLHGALDFVKQFLMSIMSDLIDFADPIWNFLKHQNFLLNTHFTEKLVRTKLKPRPQI